MIDIITGQAKTEWLHRTLLSHHDATGTNKTSRYVRHCHYSLMRVPRMYLVFLLLNEALLKNIST